jgi:hypothetical protein
MMNELEFPIERLNKFFSNHIFEVYLQPTHDEDFTIPTNVKVELIGVKNYISYGNETPHIQYTLYILPTDEESDNWNTLWGKIYGKDTEISTTSNEYSTIRWIMNDKLQNFLKYFGVNEHVICTRVVNKVESKKTNIKESVGRRHMNFVKKYLQTQQFDIDGYVYSFLKVESDTAYTFEFTVNVELPKKGQSYLRIKLEGDIDDIIRNLIQYLGDQFIYRTNILIDGEKSSRVYITEEKKEELIQKLNKKVRSMVIDEDDYMLGFKTKWKAYKDFYGYNGDTVNLNVDLVVDDFDYNGKPSIPKEQLIPHLRNFLNERLDENDSFVESLDIIGYEVLENELGITSGDDIYIKVRFWINEIMGNSKSFGLDLPLNPLTFS